MRAFKAREALRVMHVVHLRVVILIAVPFGSGACGNLLKVLRSVAPSIRDYIFCWTRPPSWRRICCQQRYAFQGLDRTGQVVDSAGPNLTLLRWAECDSLWASCSDFVLVRHN